MTQLSVFLSHHWPPQITPYRVLHDAETGALWRRAPEVFHAGVDARSMMTEPWQRYWYALLKPYMPGTWDLERCLQAWRSITGSGRAYTNGTGTDTHADYISGLNLNQPTAAWDKCRVNGGGVVNVLREAPELLGGEPFLMIETLEGNGTPPSARWVNWTLTPWLVQLAVTVNEGGVDPWAQLDGNPLPVPVVSPGGYNFIERDRLVKLATFPPAPCPYVPARW